MTIDEDTEIHVRIEAVEKVLEKMEPVSTRGKVWTKEMVDAYDELKSALAIFNETFVDSRRDRDCV